MSKYNKEQRMKLLLNSVYGQKCYIDTDRTNSNKKNLLSSDTRAEVLNSIDEVLAKYNLEVASYEDNNGLFFNISLWKKEG